MVASRLMDMRLPYADRKAGGGVTAREIANDAGKAGYLWLAEGQNGFLRMANSGLP